MPSDWTRRVLQPLRQMLVASTEWQIQPAAAQAVVTRFLGTSLGVLLVVLALIPLIGSAPLWNALMVGSVALAAWLMWRLARRGAWRRALHWYGVLLMALMVFPLLLFGRNPAVCALVLLTLLPTVLMVLGVRVALLQLASFMLTLAAVQELRHLGVPLPELFLMHVPVQMLTVLCTTLSVALPMLVLLEECSRERQRANQALQEREQAQRSLLARSDGLAQRLTDAELVLRSALEAIGEPFVLFDAQDRLVYCNEEYRRAYQKAAAMIDVGRHFEEILRCAAETGIYPEAEGQIDAWVAQTMAAHRTAVSPRIQKLEGERWVKVLERRTESGYLVSFRIDITEQYRAKEAAESASRAKSEFLAIMSHEIRTPMNAVLGMAQLLRNPDLGYQERMAAAHTILRSGQAMMEVLNDILDLAKIESGAFELRPQSFDPVKLGQEALQLFVALALSRSLSLTLHSELEPGQRYIADSGRVRQILSNLIGNAIKFTEQGGVRIEVREVERGDNGALLEYSVSDTGAGIDPQQLPKMFLPFTQGDSSNSRKHGGTGLGLSIVERVARLMGGSAGASSVPGAGSRFWFRVRAQLGESYADTAPVPLSLPTRALSGHVLVVEDEPIHRKLLAMHLGKMGVSHEAVADGEKALQILLSNRHFDLVLMDMNLPLLGGLEVTRARRDWERRQHLTPVAIVAVTANAFDIDRSNCLDAGMNDFVSKPVNYESLLQLLHHWLPEAPLAGALPWQPLTEQARAELLTRSEQLLPLLTRHAFAALGEVRGLCELVAQTPYQPQLETVAKLLKQMDFAAAEAALREVMHTLREGEHAA